MSLKISKEKMMEDLICKNEFEIPDCDKLFQKFKKLRKVEKVKNLVLQKIKPDEKPRRKIKWKKEENLIPKFFEEIPGVGKYHPKLVKTKSPKFSFPSSPRLLPIQKSKFSLSYSLPSLSSSPCSVVLKKEKRKKNHFSSVSPFSYADGVFKFLQKQQSPVSVKMKNENNFKRSPFNFPGPGSYDASIESHSPSWCLYNNCRWDEEKFLRKSQSQILPSSFSTLSKKSVIFSGSRISKMENDFPGPGSYEQKIEKEKSRVKYLPMEREGERICFYQLSKPELNKRVWGPF